MKTLEKDDLTAGMLVTVMQRNVLAHMPDYAESKIVTTIVQSPDRSGMGLIYRIVSVDLPYVMLQQLAPWAPKESARSTPSFYEHYLAGTESTRGPHVEDARFVVFGLVSPHFAAAMLPGVDLKPLHPANTPPPHSDDSDADASAK